MPRNTVVMLTIAMVYATQSTVLGWTISRVGKITFANAETARSSFFVDGDTVSYMSNGEVFQYNGHQSVQISNTAGRVMEFSASSESVVWSAYDGHDSELFLYRGGVTSQLTDNDVNDVRPDVSGCQVTWTASEGNRVMFYDGSTTRQVGNGSYSRVCAGRVAWTSGYDVFLYDGSVVQQLTSGASSWPMWLEVSDQCVAWTSDIAGPVLLNDGDSTVQLGRGCAPQLSGRRVLFATPPSPNFVGNTLMLYDGSDLHQVPGTQGFLSYSPAFCGDDIAWLRMEGSDDNGLNTIMLYDGVSVTSLWSMNRYSTLAGLSYEISAIMGDVVRGSSSMVCWYQPDPEGGCSLYAAVVPEPSTVAFFGVAFLAVCRRVSRRIRTF